MPKKIKFGGQPERPKIPAPEEWIGERKKIFPIVEKEEQFPMTFHLPKNLHNDFKVRCAAESVKMKNKLIKLIEDWLKKDSKDRG